MIPLPPGRGLFVWGRPVWVSSERTEAHMESKRRELETVLNRLTAEADAIVTRHSSLVTRKTRH